MGLRRTENKECELISDPMINRNNKICDARQHRTALIGLLLTVIQNES